MTYHPAPKSTKHLDSKEKNAHARSKVLKKVVEQLKPMDKAPAYGAGDYGLIFCFFFFHFCDLLEFVLSVVKKEKVFLVILFCCLVRNKKFVRTEDRTRTSRV